jgi:bacteriochlorophyll 4-vinyl reductase
MSEAAIGRLLVATLHQSIADVLPTRLGFYENWLSPEGMRTGTIGLAPLNAVLSFLRHEGAAYEIVTQKAGEYAAEWTVESMPSWRRSAITASPVWLRRRLLVRLGGRIVHATYHGSRAVARVRKGTTSVDVRASVFCSVREPVGHPLCGYYAATFTRLLALFALPLAARVVACRGAGGASCLLSVAVREDEVGPVNGQEAA